MSVQLASIVLPDVSGERELRGPDAHHVGARLAGLLRLKAGALLGLMLSWIALCMLRRCVRCGCGGGIVTN